MFYLGFLVGFIFCIVINRLLCYIENRKVKKKESERCSNQDVHWADTFYIDVATGKYYFASDLMLKYGRKKLAELVACGKFVNEVYWNEMQEKKNNGARN